MKNTFRLLITLSLLLGASFIFTACSDNSAEDAADEASDAMKDGADVVEDAAEDAADAVKDATN